ncbi:hypothetical protein BDV06DRAFT_38882 [Aspergillus oleicola]
MQFLKDLSESIFSRPPPQPPSNESPSLPPADFDTSPPTNAAASPEPPVRNALSPNSKDSKGSAPFDSVAQQHDQSPAPNSYANSYRPPRKPESVRRLLRQSIPHPGSGMPKQ